MKTRVAILGYGNLGKGVEAAIAQNEDLELVCVFTRRDPASLTLRTPNVPVCSVEQAPAMRDQIDVLLLCGGSATDLPQQTPNYASMFNVVDSFDTHAKIPEHFARVDAAAKAAGTVALISCGWDPGLFSLARVYANAVLPQGKDETFWGRGVSQGHSDAIRRIEGVQDARQYTVPIQAAVDRVRNGEQPVLTARDKHLRECWVVAAPGADKARIEREIKTMPYYFDEYDTTVTFITQEEMDRDHAALPHGGSVLRGGVTGWNRDHKHTVEFSLKLDSNPEFTGSVLAACARAVHRMAQAGMTGCKTILDVPPAWLSPRSGEDLRAHML
ncbi:MAG: diaminopimelate dehydrogenase [Oscillospiraceae bacterium]|nr:diaminopimelate dehydrogenase [Oscillospiraceae bacterium]